MKARATGVDSLVLQEFSVEAGRVTSLLRLPLVALVLLIGVDVPRATSRHEAFLAIWIAFALWATFVVWWMYRRPIPLWTSWLTTFVDLAAFVALAATSAGATSYITPVFYLYPLAVAFQYRPRLTAVVGVLIAGGYVLTWLPNLGKAGGPGVPLVVWLYSGLLLWLAAASTILTVVLVRRSASLLQLLNDYQQLAAKTLLAAEREQARIADDLHDGPLQNLIAVRRNLEELADRHPGHPLLTQSDLLLRDTIQTLRGTVTVLHPQVLTQLGLTPALEELAIDHAATNGVTVHTSLADVGHIATKNLIYGTVRELLTNITKHAQAQNIWVTTIAERATLTIEVVDDGTGFDVSTIGERTRDGHIGLASRSLRIADVGGGITITPRVPHGTRVQVQVPLLN